MPAKLTFLAQVARIAQWWRLRRVLAGVAVGAVVAGGALAVLLSPALADSSCDLDATPATFAAQVAVANPGQTICLKTGDYGTWSGTDKAITVTAAGASTPTMQVNFAGGAAGFTLSGMNGMGGMIGSGASDITIENSTFAQQLYVEGTMENIVVMHDSFTYPVESTADGPNSKIFLDTTPATGNGTAITVEYNDIENGDLDGVNVGGGSGIQIIGNYIADLCDLGVNHTDDIQFESGTGDLVALNYLYESEDCPVQGITSYDGGTDGLTIEDNVVDIPRDWGIELYSDQDSVVAFNTLVWHPAAYSEFGDGTGWISLDNKTGDPPSTGTTVEDNICCGDSGSPDISSGTDGTFNDNASAEYALYTGPDDTFTGFALDPSSPVGVGWGPAGIDDGARFPATPLPAYGPLAETTTTSSSGTSTTSTSTSDTTTSTSTTSTSTSGTPTTSTPTTSTATPSPPPPASTPSSTPSSTPTSPASTSAPPSPGSTSGAPTTTSSSGANAPILSPLLGGTAPAAAPIVSGFRFLPADFFAGSHRSKGGQDGRAGTSIRFQLSVAGRVTITIERRSPGRLTRGRCRTPVGRSRRPNCSRRIPVATLTKQGRAGRDAVAFAGVVGGRRLRPGRYDATIIVTDGAGRPSDGVAAAFTIA